MSRNRLQGHNEAEAWSSITRLRPRAVLRMEWFHEPVDHWSVTVIDPSLGDRPVTGNGYTRYEALNQVVIALEKEERIQAEMMERSA